MTSDQYPKVYLYQRIVQAKQFIDHRYAEKIDLDNISDEAHFSKFHFIRLFKSIYGKTPHQYLQFVRIEKARLLLKENDSVSNVCYLVGFDSVSTFSGLFTKMVGKTPSKFISESREKKFQVKENPLSFVPGCYAYMHGWSENSNFEEEKV
ncbi:MAG TPA: AraC family transcriptional regulator [Saprospiraceae bacterium]|nr:AraC family transcriptional regulator [Saprospiraceae bacterium]HPN70042.1 AraC family transcriptional regulator [Saprospiraceae bacterium]